MSLWLEPAVFPVLLDSCVLYPYELRDPFAGIGKPEPLRENLAGCWSRRIDEEHRLVYQLDGELLVILASRYHVR